MKNFLNRYFADELTSDEKQVFCRKWTIVKNLKKNLLKIRIFWYFLIGHFRRMRMTKKLRSKN